MRRDRTNYRAYLLRLWKTPSTAPGGQEGGWRVTLEELHTRKPLAFATMERFFAFLVDQIEQADEAEMGVGEDRQSDGQPEG